MNALQMQSEEAYLGLLAKSPAECDELIEEVVIPETWFFRDEHPFRLLQDYARSRWLLDASQPPLRILSLPCAGGDEPYSAAIAMQELGLPADRCEILGVDISDRSLAKAQAATFGPSSLRTLPPEFQARFFRVEHGRWVLLEPVRSMVRFRRGNIVNANLLADERPFDAIFCRNLLIYLAEPFRRRASATLHRLLAPDGVLFLGHAERLELPGEPLESYGDSGCFAFRRKPTPQLEPPRPVAVPVPKRPVPKVHRDTRPKPPRPQVTVQTKPPAPTVAVASEPSPSLLEEAAALADQGKNDEAAERCERHLRETGPNASAYFLLGMVRQASGVSKEAEGFFQKTVYLDPQHDEALLALALMAERRGDRAAADGYRRRADRALRRREK